MLDDVQQDAELPERVMEGDGGRERKRERERESPQFLVADIEKVLFSRFWEARIHG